MEQKEPTDIIPLLKNLCIALQPFAATRNIQLAFATTEEKILLSIPPGEILTGFSRFMSAVIDYMPDNNTISLDAGILEKETAKYVSVKIKNTGIDLKMITALVNNCRLPVALHSFSTYETTYEVSYSLQSQAATYMNSPEPAKTTLFNYLSVVNGIKSHFAKLKNPVARLAETKPKEAAFLTNINSCISKNLSNDQFDANALSNAMSMSRAQLLRRLKSLTGNSPAYYIKTMRLEKAKGLLESSDVPVSEAAFQTGFNSHSNFTKVFIEKYGMSPSQFQRTNPGATNE